jgi:aryl-alcohol dehydrogenase-like predicted oxidoreductase
MKYRTLGKSELRVSEAALGTMTFGDEWGRGPRKPKRRKSMTPTAKRVETSWT